MKKWLSLLVAVLCVAGGVRGEEVSTLLKQLQNSDAEVRRSAAKQLGEMSGDDLKSAVPALAEALKKDKDLYVRRFSAMALGSIGSDAAKTALPALSGALQDSKKEVAEAAATALGKMGPTAVTALAGIVKDKTKDGEIRRKAVESLGALGKDAKPAVKVLAGVLKDKEVATEAAGALGAIGPDAQEAASALEELVADKKVRDRNLKKAASDALKKIQAKSS